MYKKCYNFLKNFLRENLLKIYNKIHTKNKEIYYTMKSTIKSLKCQEKISKKKTKVRLFADFMIDKKVKNDRLKSCGNYLYFLSNQDKTKFKLSWGNFCNNRFCPICSWLKAKKNAVEIMELMAFIREKEKKQFIFVTLTAPNVTAENLKNEIDDFNKSFKRLFQSEDFSVVNKGFIRKLEITYNSEQNTYHPHFHLIVAVNDSYFHSRYYISEKKLLEMWKKAKRDDTITQVDIRKIEMNTIQEIMEIATYSAKQKDLYSNQEVFDVFYENMRGRQLLTFNGLFKEYRKLQSKNQLNIDELDINIDAIKVNAVLEVGYKWKIKEYQEQYERLLEEWEQRYFYDFDIDID